MYFVPYKLLAEDNSPVEVEEFLEHAKVITEDMGGLLHDKFWCQARDCQHMKKFLKHFFFSLSLYLQYSTKAGNPCTFSSKKPVTRVLPLSVLVYLFQVSRSTFKKNQR